MPGNACGVEKEGLDVFLKGFLERSVVDVVVFDVALPVTRAVMRGGLPLGFPLLFAHAYLAG